jgi:hypothetical protein
MRRYYSEDGDRAVAGVGTRLKSTSIDVRGRYAAYDPYTDRIYFAKAFMTLSKEEKIITIIHEVLHATLTMKNREAQVGYERSPIGSRTYAEHEAYVDNVAKDLAKALGLIPRNYPPTPPNRYYRPEADRSR